MRILTMYLDYFSVFLHIIQLNLSDLILLRSAWYDDLYFIARTFIQTQKV